MNRRNFFKLAFASIFSPLIPKITKLLGPIHRRVIARYRFAFGKDDQILTGWTRVLNEGDIIALQCDSAQDIPLMLDVWIVGETREI